MELDDLLLKVAHWLGCRVWQRFPEAAKVSIAYGIRLQEGRLKIYISVNGEFAPFNGLLLNEVGHYLPISGICEYSHLKNKNVVVARPSAHEVIESVQEFELWLGNCRALSAC